MKKYVISVAYRNGAIAKSDKSYQCKINVGRRPGFVNYAFICPPVKSWEEREENSPVLEVQEIKDNRGVISFLEVGILKWEGSIPGEIFVNDHCVLPLHEIREGRIQNSVGLVRRIPVELFQAVEPTSVHSPSFLLFSDPGSLLES